MPKRTKVTTIKEELPESLQIADPESTSLPLDESSIELSQRLQEIRAQLGKGSDDINIKVYRVIPGKQPAFCFSAKSVDEEVIQQRCKSGSFQCKVIAGGSVIDVIDVEIDESVIQAPSQNGSDPVLSLLMQQNAQLMNAFTQMIANGGNKSEQPTMMQVIEAVKSVKDLAGGGSDAVAMKMFEKGIDLATKVGGFGEKSWTTELFETIKEVASPLVPAIVQAVNGKQPNPQQQELQAMTPEQQNEMYLRQAIAGIKQQALANVPVGLVLEWIENHAQEYANLIRIVVTSDFATIVKLDPDIAGSESLSAYFKTLYDGLRLSHQESATLDVDSGGEGGDEEDNTENGIVSAPIVVEPDVIHASNKPRKSTRN